MVHPPIKRFACLRCGAKFERKEYLINHLSRKNPCPPDVCEMSLLEVADELGLPLNNCTCEHCGKQFSTNQRLRSHVENKVCRKKLRLSVNANANAINANTLDAVTQTDTNPMTIDPMIYLLGEDAYELLRGKSIRVTDDGRMSLYDFIEAMTGNANPIDTWNTIKDKVHEVIERIDNLKFPGPGQRNTPVITAEDAILVANHLRGPLADHLRRRCAELGKDMAGGNVNKIVGVAVGIDAHHRAGKSQGTFAALCRDKSQCEQDRVDIENLIENNVDTQLASNASQFTIPDHKYMIMSPRLMHMNLLSFSNRSVCYLLTLKGDYIKFGYTTDVLSRFGDHMREIPDLLGIWFVCEAPKEVESSFKEHMRYAGKLTSMRIGNRNHTELLKDITPESAEFELCRIVKTVVMRNDVDIRRMEIDAEIQKAQIEADKEKEKEKFIAERHRLDVELQREKMRAIFDLVNMNLPESVLKLALDKLGSIH